MVGTSVDLSSADPGGSARQVRPGKQPLDATLLVTLHTTSIHELARPGSSLGCPAINPWPAVDSFGQSAAVLVSKGHQNSVRTAAWSDARSAADGAWLRAILHGQPGRACKDVEVATEAGERP